MNIRTIARRFRHKLGLHRQRSKLESIALETTKQALPLREKNHVFNVAVVGAGAMGRDQCLGIEAISQATIVAVADRNAGALERLKQELDLSNVGIYADVEEMFAKEDLDLVCIATNTNSHLQIAQLAVDRKIPRMIIEKPIGNKVSAARSLERQCQEKSIKISVNQSRRWSDTYAAILRCIDKGFIGDLRQINMSIGPGGFAMIGSHFIDLASYLGRSPIAWITGIIEDEVEPNKRGAEFYDPSGYAMFELENGLRATVDLSMDLIRMKKYISLIGTTGSIEIDERYGIWHISNDILERNSFRFTGAMKPVGYFTRVVQEILSDVPPSCTAATAINTLEAIMAVHISHRNGNRRVDLPLKGADADLELAFP